MQSSMPACICQKISFLTALLDSPSVLDSSNSQSSSSVSICCAYVSTHVILSLPNDIIFYSSLHLLMTLFFLCVFLCQPLWIVLGCVCFYVNLSILLGCVCFYVNLWILLGCYFKHVDFYVVFRTSSRDEKRRWCKISL